MVQCSITYNGKNMMSVAFNQNLKLMREICGFSQAELAEKLGLKRAVISTYERGANVPKFDTLIKLRMLFEIDLPKILKAFTEHLLNGA